MAAAMQIHTALLNFAGLGVHEEYSLEHADMLATLLEDVQVVYTALSSQMGVAVVPTQTELLRRMFYFYRELLVSVEDEGSTLEGCMTFVQQRILQVATSLMPPPRHPHAFQTLQGLLFMYLTTVMLMRKRPYDGGDGHWMVYLPNGPVFEQIKLQWRPLCLYDPNEAASAAIAFCPLVVVTQYVPVIADQQDFIDVLGARMNDGRDALNWLRGFLPRMCQQMATMASNSELVQMLMREQVHE